MNQICTRCVMDTSDPGISFDSEGVCNHCHLYDELVQKLVFDEAEAKRQLDSIVAKMKANGKGKPYDCIIGISGGVDSTYTAYLVRKLGLRPLAIHLDNGWDSELAVKNIEQTLNKLNVELLTHVLNWEEFRDLQLAFLKASTPDSEIPSDHAIVSLMYETAMQKDIRYVVSGCNVRTETHVPRAWSTGHGDWRYIKIVHRQFGTRRLTNYPHRGFIKDRMYTSKVQWIDILNYVDYVKKDAMKVLENELGWKYYGGKHYESIYTRFYQGYLLPKKFGYDKRRSHLSSLVCSGEITRSDALKELLTDPYPSELQAEDLAYVIKKLGLTQAEFDEIMRLPKRTIDDYGAVEDSFMYRFLRTGYRFARLLGIVRQA